MTETPSTPPQLFTAPATVAVGALGESSKSRSMAEVMAMMTAAKRFPRDETASYAKVMKSCQRQGLAEMSAYEYSKGGTSISGPSIHLAKATAQAWGNMEFGWRELDRKNGASECEAFAWDVENNTRNSTAFTVKHWRDTKQGGYAIKDEREIYELCANQAARRMRACILSVIPGDVVDAALTQCDMTLKGKSNEPLSDRARKMVAAFSEFGVTHEMIETHLQHKLDAITETQLAKLRRIYTAIKDGVAKVEDHFTKPAPKPHFDDTDQLEGAEIKPKEKAAKS